ncbi:putative DNA primase/helicase [Paraburkholderia tropica]|uniref:toprim domain-containing protein n=1 Tax=Paraburkholderia tropica TaxID=92647 RepID=UPI00160E6712|nr:toprim domain-containing protein [Paraburkholderia tropica]MBB2999670.1 putative DNA primase/helicase [Paraburkholderia tropica]
MRFDDFARAHGLIIREVIADGKPHRVPTEDHPRKLNGAYGFDGQSGWVQNWAVHEKAIKWCPRLCDIRPVAIPKRDRAAEAKAETERRARARASAREIVGRCSYDVHPYLERKGFGAERGLIDTDGRLVVPMRDVTDYERVNSVQWINDQGEKKFLTGGAARGSVFAMGSGREHWLVEGFATGLSVREALRMLHRSARVVVCFSAGNLQHVATMMGGKRFVIADNDKSGTGARVALATGLPWAMPPVEGDDANDLHLREGINPLVQLMRNLLRIPK